MLTRDRSHELWSVDRLFIYKSESLSTAQSNALIMIFLGKPYLMLIDGLTHNFKRFFFSVFHSNIPLDLDDRVTAKLKLWFKVSNSVSTL